MITVLFAAFFFTTGEPIVDSERMPSWKVCRELVRGLEAAAKSRDYHLQSVRAVCFHVRPRPSV